MTTACSRCGLLHPGGSPCFTLALPGERDAQGLQPGTMLAGRYHIVRTIHRGGMSMVYLAEDTMQNREVAIKELRLPAGASEEEVREAKIWFARESYLLSTLQHPLIPRFYSVFLEEDRSYIVQEYVDGENLDQVIGRQGPFAEDVVVRWATALCDLLAYLHDRAEPVIFRDLKPANILLRASDGALVVVDFGIARPYQADLVGTVVGTPGYAPPEQYQGLATPQSDVYALGATLHRLLTGYDPEHEAPFTFPPVRSLNPAVSLPFAAAIERATALDPRDRYESAAEMNAALGRVRLRPFVSGGAARASGAGARRMWSGLAVAVLLAPLLMRALAASEGPSISMSPTMSGSYVVSQFVGGACMQLSMQPEDPGMRLSPGASITLNDGVLWFTDQVTTALDYLAPGGEIGSCLLNTQAAPQDLAGGAGGSLWLSDAVDGIEQFPPQGLATNYQPDGTNTLAHIAVDPSGNLWFTQPASNRIGRANSSGGDNGGIDEWPLPASESTPEAIAAAPDGTMWFTELGDRIGRITAQGTTSGYNLPDRAPTGLAGITAGSDRNMWFTEAQTNRIGRITPSGAIKEFNVPTPDAGLGAITLGPDGACWFVEQRANKIGRITPDGTISEFPIPSANSGPGGISAGPDGAVWFTETNTGRLGRIDAGGTHVIEIPAVTGPGAMTTWRNTAVVRSAPITTSGTTAQQP
jgi:streptogramin lyase/tRNA A-37 threonylcarbamoyl transferase component Bud32